MKVTKEELLAKVREHGGETPDDYTISLLEDITDSMDEIVDNSVEYEQLKEAFDSLNKAHAELTDSYEALRKSYADRFVLKDVTTDSIEEAKTAETEDSETYDSIFE